MVADASDPKRREQRYHDLLDFVVELSKMAKAAGLDRFQVECTPLAREVPYTFEQGKKFLKDLDGRCVVSVKLLVGVGHALYQPLFGPGARMPEWLNGLGDSFGAFHLQNTDFRGLFDVARFAGEVPESGLENVPAFIEITTVRLKVEENQLVNVFGEIGIRIEGLKGA